MQHFSVALGLAFRKPQRLRKVIWEAEQPIALLGAKTSNLNRRGAGRAARATDPVKAPQSAICGAIGVPLIVVVAFLDVTAIERRKITTRAAVVAGGCGSVSGRMSAKPDSYSDCRRSLCHPAQRASPGRVKVSSAASSVAFSSTHIRIDGLASKSSRSEAYCIFACLWSRASQIGFSSHLLTEVSRNLYPNIRCAKPIDFTLHKSVELLQRLKSLGYMLRYDNLDLRVQRRRSLQLSVPEHGYPLAVRMTKDSKNRHPVCRRVPTGTRATMPRRK